MKIEMSTFYDLANYFYLKDYKYDTNTYVFWELYLQISLKGSYYLLFTCYTALLKGRKKELKS